ncbi:MAG: DinB family protein, partial [Bradyrhizobium sp.]|nr:DinB family protein [Bradyrhizobium sp.]
RTLAIHNQRINDRLLNLSIELSEVDLLADRGAFFGSIFNHWNHLMFGDLMLLRRIRDGSPGSDVLDELATFPTPKTPRDVYYHDMVTLAHNRRRLDSLLVKWAMSVPGPTLGQKLRYTSTEGDPIVIARGKLALHLFMHQLHHRGQLTTLLSQLGIDYGSTDMPLIVPEALDSLCWSR